MKKTAITLICILLCLAFLQHLFLPKYMEGVTEGSFVADYYRTLEQYPGELREAAASGGDPLHDVLFLGDCEVYNNLSTVTLWETYGMNSFIRGTPQQTMWQSYYLLEETLRYETPRVVVLSVFAMQYDTPQNEIYNRMTLDNMKWSRAKLSSVRASMTEDEHLAGYVFPLLRFHDRWKSLEKQDLTYLLKKKNTTFHGYDLRMGVQPVTTLPTPLPLSDPRFGENAYAYLDRITALCKEKNIPLVLIKAPSLYPHWYDEWDEQMKTYADTNGLRYINLLSLQEETGINYEADTYDGGLHLNVEGAEKCAAYLGDVLRKEYDLPDRRTEETLSLHWEALLDNYAKEKRNP